MKITDYGVWFTDVLNIWSLEPSLIADMYLDGNWISTRYFSSLTGKPYFFLDLFYLSKISFKISPEAPGKQKGLGFWYFPDNYVPKYSNFEKSV